MFVILKNVVLNIWYLTISSLTLVGMDFSWSRNCPEEEHPVFCCISQLSRISGATSGNHRTNYQE